MPRVKRGPYAPRNDPHHQNLSRTTRWRKTTEERTNSTKDCNNPLNAEIHEDLSVDFVDDDNHTNTSHSTGKLRIVYVIKGDNSTKYRDFVEKFHLILYLLTKLVI